MTQQQPPSTYEEAIDGARLFTVVHGRKMGDNRHSLKEVRFRLDIRKNFFTMLTDRHRPMLSGKTVQSICGGFRDLNKQSPVLWTGDLQRALPTLIFLCSYYLAKNVCCLDAKVLQVPHSCYYILPEIFGFFLLVSDFLMIG